MNTLVAAVIERVQAHGPADKQVLDCLVHDDFDVIGRPVVTQRNLAGLGLDDVVV